jgi:hypothetical protein
VDKKGSYFMITDEDIGDFDNPFGQSPARDYKDGREVRDISLSTGIVSR